MHQNATPFGKKSYPYAIGRVRAREASLLNAAKWNQLIEADEEQALKLLREAGYGDGGEADIDLLTERELTKTAAFIREITPNPALTDPFFLPADAHNLKVLLKARLIKENADSLLSPEGIYPVELLKLCIEHEELSPLGEPAAGMLSGIWTVTDPKKLSGMVDRAILAQINASPAVRASALIRSYFETQAGWLDRIAVARGRQLGWEDSSLAPLLLSADGHPALSDEAATPSELERQMNRELLKLVREHRFESDSIAPILCFLLEKREEARKLRLLFVSKRAGQPFEYADADGKGAGK